MNWAFNLIFCVFYRKRLVDMRAKKFIKFILGVEKFVKRSNFGKKITEQTFHIQIVYKK